MKEMIYSAKRTNKILDTGFCFGLLYYILSLGTHPTAYIRLPKKHKLYGKGLEEVGTDIDVHFGITYSENGLYVEDQTIKGWFIG